jgi:hypothetical protein
MTLSDPPPARDLAPAAGRKQGPDVNLDQALAGVNLDLALAGVNLDQVLAHVYVTH